MTTTFTDLMEGPEHAPHTTLRQVGWLGANTATFYPWGTDERVIRRHEPGSYSPIYIEVGDD